MVKKKSPGNGLDNFSMHSSDRAQAGMVRSLALEAKVNPTFAFAEGATPATLDPETAARGYVEQALASKSVAAFTAPSAESDLKVIDSETVPLTQTVVVKFRQRYHDVPVYGSLVSVELDDKNELVGINSAMGSPGSVSAIAKVSPAEALKTIERHPGYRKELRGAAPRLYYFYDQPKLKWRLVFVVEDVKVFREGKARPDWTPRFMDYVVDAHTGKLVAELPRTAHIAEDQAKDGKGDLRKFGVDGGAKKLLFDTTLNVQTFDFRFKDPSLQQSSLPGNAISSPPKWTPAAVSAHANASEVSRFLRTELVRNNIDNRGGIMKSSINCVLLRESPGGNVWINAFWNGEQMVYGQRKNGAGFLSLCIDLDVVAHEMFHGVTENTARLEYRTQSGALNESYSDIFGIIVANFAQPDVAKWSWEIGAGLTEKGTPFRSMKDPALFGQPANMKDFKRLPVTEKGDQGGVHTNSGIHNKAAFNMLTAKSGANFALSPKEVASIFYLALTQRLAATSQFADSRRAVVQSAQTLFRNLPAAELSVKIAAINKAFDDVGIV